MFQILAAAFKAWPLGTQKRQDLQEYDVQFRAEVESLFHSDLAALKRSPMERRGANAASAASRAKLAGR